MMQSNQAKHEIKEKEKKNFSSVSSTPISNKLNATEIFMGALD